MKIWKKALAVLTMGGVLLTGTPALAAEPVQDGMAAFREAYQAVKDDYRVFDEELTLFGPAFHVDLDSRGKVAKDGSMLLSGKLELMFTEHETGKINNFDVPFYLDQTPSNLTFYVQLGKKWNKISLPGAYEMSDALATSAAEAEENMAIVKSVEIVKETDTKRSMNLKLDGKKLAALVAKHWQEDLKNLKPEEKAVREEALNRLTKAFESVDQEVTWAVNKTNWQTITAGMNLTNLMRAYAKVVLQEAADGKIKLSDGEREIWETLAYYAELHSYTQYPTGDNVKVEIPAKVKKSATELNIMGALQKEATAKANSEKK